MAKRRKQIKIYRVAFGSEHLKCLREMRDAGGIVTLRAGGEWTGYEDLKNAGCIEIFPLFLSDIRCETLLKYGVRTSR